MPNKQESTQEGHIRQHAMHTLIYNITTINKTKTKQNQNSSSLLMKNRITSV